MMAYYRLVTGDDLIRVPRWLNTARMARDAYRPVCSALGIEPPELAFMVRCAAAGAEYEGSAARGVYLPGRVLLNVDADLPAMTHAVLHETRHAWQESKGWTVAGAREYDAERFAQKHCPFSGCEHCRRGIRATVTQSVGGKFRRLSPNHGATI